MNCFLFRLLPALLVALSPTLALAHNVPGANLQLIADLTEEELAFEISSETSLVAPLADITFATTPLPTMEERKKAVEDYFQEHCPVLVDGIAVSPILTNLEFEKMDDEINLGETQDFVMAFFILSYPLKTRPKTVDMTWGIFLPEKAAALSKPVPGEVHNPLGVDSVFYTYGDLDTVSFSPKEPQFIWHASAPLLSVDAERRLTSVNPSEGSAKSPRKNLTLAGVLALTGLGLASVAKQRPTAKVIASVFLASGFVIAGWQPLRSEVEAPSLSLDAAKQRFMDLHQNIYRAFDYDSDDQIYDTLAQSVTGDLLDQIYQEVYRSLVMKDEGGAMCRVKKLDYVSVEASPSVAKPDAIEVNTHWRVFGLVQHWGHTHQRVNEYQARYQLGSEQGVWKIIGVTIDREKRLNPENLEPVN